PALQRLINQILDSAPRGDGVLLVHKILKARPKTWPHQLLTRSRLQNHLNRLAYALFQSWIVKPSLLIRERQQGPTNRRRVWCLTCHNGSLFLRKRNTDLDERQPEKNEV